MNAKTQLVCLYCSYAFMVLFGIGFVMAGFLPPPGPSESALQIARHFQDHTTVVRLGIIICLGSSALLVPWGCGVAVQMRRIEGANTPLTYIWIAATALVALEFIYACAFWGVAAFVLLFKTGPFAWDGVISYWMLFTVGFGRFIVVTVMSARAVRAEALEPDPLPRDLDLVTRVAALERALSDANVRIKETIS